MTHVAGILDRLEHASNAAEALGAAYDAFEAMLSVIAAYQDCGGPFYAALVMAAAAAADGRDAVAAAPSLPLRSSAAEALGGVPLACAEPEQAAAAVAGLAKSASGRLHLAASVAELADDRVACTDGTRHANEVHLLITGSLP